MSKNKEFLSNVHTHNLSIVWQGTCACDPPVGKKKAPAKPAFPATRGEGESQALRQNVPTRSAPSSTPGRGAGAGRREPGTQEKRPQRNPRLPQPQGRKGESQATRKKRGPPESAPPSLQGGQEAESQAFRNNRAPTKIHAPFNRGGGRERAGHPGRRVPNKIRGRPR